MKRMNVAFASQNTAGGVVYWGGCRRGGGGRVNEYLHGMRSALRKLEHRVGTTATSKTTNDKPILFYSRL